MRCCHYLAVVFIFFLSVTTLQVKTEELGAAQVYIEDARVVGRLVYVKRKLLLANVEGIISEIFVSAGQKISEKHEMIRVASIDPVFSDQTEFNHEPNIHIGEFFVRKGDKVHRNSPLLSMVRKKDLIATANLVPHKIKHFKLGDKVSVRIDPGESSQQIYGEVIAIHEVTVSSLARVKIDVRLDSDSCLQNVDCASLLVANSVVLISKLSSSKQEKSNESGNT
ncbi:hypothetical protein [Pseudoalteromonas sp. ASV78]|uniref:hypothetical protein n=1 Tax=Pseudoalteromonas sp. ASV78 TaxID=3397851 RepID=UPI0039FBA669